MFEAAQIEIIGDLIEHVDRWFLLPGIPMVKFQAFGAEDREFVV